MKKGVKYIMMTAVIFIMVLSFSGCKNLFDDSSIRTKTEQILDYIIAGEQENAYAMLADNISKEEFETGYIEIRDALKGVESYELKRYSFRRNASSGSNGITSLVSASYAMTTNVDKFMIEVEENPEIDKLSHFNIVPYQHTALYYTGTIGHMEGANGLQWGLVIFAALEFLFVLIVLVDCCRRKVKYKILWILLILLGTALFSISVGTHSFNMNFNIFFNLSHTALIIYGNGTKVFQLTLPIGSFFYLAFRKQITKKEDVAQEMESTNL